MKAEVSDRNERETAGGGILVYGGGEEFFSGFAFQVFFGTRAKLSRGSFQVVLEKLIVKKW